MPSPSHVLFQHYHRQADRDFTKYYTYLQELVNRIFVNHKVLVIRKNGRYRAVIVRQTAPALSTFVQRWSTFYGTRSKALLELIQYVELYAAGIVDQLEAEGRTFDFNSQEQLVNHD